MNFAIYTKRDSRAKRLTYLSFISLTLIYELYGREFLNLNSGLPSWVSGSFIGLFVFSALIYLIVGVGLEITVDNGILTLRNSGYLKVYKKTYAVNVMKVKICDETIVIIDENGFGNAPIAKKDLAINDWDKILSYFRSEKLI